MRKLLFILLLITVTHLIAVPVSESAAMECAQNWYLERTGNNEGISEIIEIREQGVIVLYAINLESGFILLAADDLAIPVFGYSDEGTYDPNNLPPQMGDMLSWQKLEIYDGITSNATPSHEIVSAWEHLRAEEFMPMRDFRDVSPLLSTTWDQGQYYNQLCPADNGGPGGHVWAGCVATAMAQVMKYWSFPETGVGSHSYYDSNYGTQSANFGATTYNWSSMPNAVNYSNTSVATLFYHLGVSVDMQYSIDGSGAYSGDARDALVNYFQYDDAAQLLWKSDYPVTTWNTMLRTELDNDRPLYYRGENPSSGHAFNIDGYQGTDYFHLNWGWSGSYNGYFYLDDMTPGSSNFNSDQAAILYLEPSLQPEITVTDPNGGESYAQDESINITWTSQDIGNNVRIMLYDGNTLDELISDMTSNDGSFNWAVPADFSVGDNYRIKIADYDNSSTNDYSDGYFSIYNPTLQELENVVITVGGADVNVGDDFNIEISTSELDQTWNLISYQFTFYYDAALMTYEGYTAGYFMGNILAYESTPGEITVAYANAMPISGAGDLVILNFNAVSEGTSSLDIGNFRYNTYDITNIISGEVNIIAYSPFQDVTITAGSGNVTVDNELVIPISTTMMTSDMGAISFQFDLDFNPELLSFTSFSLGDVPGPGNFIANEASPGVVSVAYANVMPITGEGVLCNLVFTGEAEGTSALDLNEFKYNSTYLTNLVDGSVNIVEYSPYEDVVITAGSANAAIGNTVEIPVSTTELISDMGAISFQFDLAFDISLLTFDSFSLGEVPGPGNLIANESSPGVISVAYANVMPITGEGNLCYLTFTADAAGTSDLVLDEFKYNSTYLSNLVDGSIMISAVQYPDWSINPPDYQYNASIWGIVLLDDVEVDITSGMLGCFVGDECRGIASLEEGSLIDYTVPFGHIIFLPMVYSNVTSGETLDFLYFDAITEEVYTVAESIPFVADTVVGDGMNPFEFHASTVTTVDVSKEIVSGWNWFSVNVVGEDMGINSVLSSIGNNGANIKNQSQSAIYYEGAGWFGSLNNINNLSLYKLEANNAVTWEYTGVPVDLASTTYNLNSGWNWISYAPQESEAINYALDGLENGANIKNQSQSAIYYAGAGWFGSLNTMDPTAGYMLQMNEAEQHNYPAPDGDFVAVNEEENLSAKTISTNNGTRAPDWSINPADYQYNGSIWGIVMFNGVEVDITTKMLGCFVGDECRGIASDSSVLDYTDPFPFGHIIFLPMVYSNVTSGETLTFKYWDAGSGIILDAAETIEWEADMVVGDGYEPYVFTVNTNSNGEDEITPTQITSCYPNPFNPEVTISFYLQNIDNADLSIYNLRGQKVTTLYNGVLAEGNHSYIWDGKNDKGIEQANGVYFYRLQTGGEFHSGKMLMLK
ncbi:MAG: C10 family peptidase [Candidatus Stygibacter frigidus]|nr:C10 family peptidase [Candidatus Stygibacter frigidus]